MGPEWALVALMAVGTAASVVGTIASARAQRNAGVVEQQGYEYNAQVYEAEAEQVKETAAYNEALHRKKVRALISKQRALYAHAGVDLAEGSPLLVLAETAAEGEEEALMIRREGEVEATRLRNQAQISRYYGGSAAAAGKAASKTTLLTGLGQAGMNFGLASRGMWGGGGSEAPSGTPGVGGP